MKLRTTKNNLPESTREKVTELLQARLVDAIDLYSQIKQAHWNVKGPTFHQLHLLFDAIAGEVEEGIDELAERGVQLGGYALGTVREAAKKSSLTEYPSNIQSGQDHVQAVSNVLAAVAKNIREAIDTADELGDKDTADLFTNISRTLDKNLWFVESHLG